MKIDGAKIPRTSFSYANIIKEQVANIFITLHFIDLFFGQFVKVFPPPLFCLFCDSNHWLQLIA